MKKTIHIYSQYYFPISNACANRVEKYILALKDDYDIKIITGMPNYPTGIKDKKYKWKLYKKEFGNFGEEIIRTYEFASKNQGFILRTLNYLSFMFSSSLYGLLTKNPDLIIVTSPSLFTAIGVLILNKIRKIPYILEIRDLWPDSVVALGFMKENSLSYKIFSWLEISLYKNAQKIIGVTKGICNSIENKGIEKSKIDLFYNVFNTNQNLDYTGEELNEIIKKYNLDTSKKIFLYAGNHSKAQNLYNILNLAKNYNNGNFYFLGDGETKNELEEYSKNNNINNVYFLGQKNKQEVYKFIKISDYCLASLDNNPLFNHAVPTKILEYLAFGKTVICFIKGDLAEKIIGYNAGLIFPEYNNELISMVDNFIYKEGSGKDLIDKYFSYNNFNKNINILISEILKNIGKK